MIAVSNSFICSHFVHCCVVADECTERMSDYAKIPSGSITVNQRGVNGDDMRPNNKNSVSLIPIRGLQIKIVLSQGGNAVTVKKFTVQTGDSSTFQYR